ncbi:MAG: glycerol-3-phosphate 1-O-acyltransferase PlsY [Balneolales bacterium]
MGSFLLIIVLSYLLGSIPTSLWMGKLYKGIDIRDYGSGNAGATNTFRMLGWKAGIVVSLIDLAKGFTAAYYISQLGYHVGDVPTVISAWETDIFMRIIAGGSAVLGHMYPLYASFKGGKGVITAAGMLFGIEPYSIAIVLVFFAIVLFTTRYVSLASIVGSILYPISLLIFRYMLNWDIDGSLIVLSAIIASIIVIKHKGNIQRLMGGTESRINSFSPSKGRLNEQQTT